MERERGALVWRLQTFGGMLPDPTLDPTLHDLDPTRASHTQEECKNLTYPDVDDDSTDDERRHHRRRLRRRTAGAHWVCERPP